MGSRKIVLMNLFIRQEYWSGFPFPSPGDLPNPGIKPNSGDTNIQTIALNTLF